MATELWAHVWRPTPSGPYPLLVFLHGNHGTCGRRDSALGIRIDDRVDYTFSGSCPGRYVVTPNHRGYDYLARPLAALGYVVVSINANRGVNGAPAVGGDPGLNLRRGRLVLRHLQRLAQWNSSGGAPRSLGFQLTGQLDFEQVGLIGHSRGGEGMRAAIAQYNDPGSPWPARIGPVDFQALFEIGPVDGQTSRVLNAAELNWNVLLPGCDGDVSDLQGIKPFDRMLRITNEPALVRKSTFLVYGANHNFYNTEWQLSDASRCLGQTSLFPPSGGSARQRKTLSETLIPFLQAHVGPIPISSLAQLFDPSQPLPSALTEVTAYARGFTQSPRSGQNFIIDNFERATGTSTRRVANQSFGLSEYRHGRAGFSHDGTQRAAAVAWNSLGGFLQVNAASASSGFSVSRFRSLEFRIALRCFGALCRSAPKPSGDLDFSIALVNGDGALSRPVDLKSYAVIRRPAGSIPSNELVQTVSSNELFQTVRIPVVDFPGADLSNFRGVRFIFDRTAQSSLYLGNVRLTRAGAASGGTPTAIAAAPGEYAPLPTSRQTETNRIVAIRRAGLSAARSTGSAVEIEVASTRPFPIGDALPTLVIGDRSFTLSRFADGSSDRLIFTLDRAGYASLSSGVEVSLRIGGARPWGFGRMRK
jgi:hypothetical protein